MAVSVSFAPKTLTTYAVVYGCDKEAADLLAARLTGTDHPVFHPMLLPTLLADMERERQVGLLRKSSVKMDQLTVDLTINKGVEGPDAASQLNQSKEIVELWQDMSYLKNGLQNWQRQLQNMSIHLGQSFNTMSQDPARYDAHVQESLENLEVPGIRIQKRLDELIDEYDEHIRDCAAVAEGLNLAMSMDTRTTNQEIANSSLEVSTLAQKDGSLMKSIAFLTMIFLPATFTSTFFSMDFFDWPKAADAIGTGYIWVYFVVAAVLTLITVGWFSALMFRVRTGGKGVTASMA
ncbi:hypothetical protein N0V84_001222 [Fusarium piperis]|uniref:Uncharacterized protein n=1 Tax=Fusarium piperis TaxID=1435070 RepID=A0A9W8WLI8_9HYPO|nr:hypothetical protein N0V84_001222 [Fusarium piperis]